MTGGNELPFNASLDALMDFCRVSLEAHRYGATLYVSGLLADLAADDAEYLVRGIPAGTTILRVDLRAVELIDPNSFVRVARALNGWRELTRGRVMIEFPRRSSRRHPLARFVPHERGAQALV